GTDANVGDQRLVQDGVHRLAVVGAAVWQAADRRALGGFVGRQLPTFCYSTNRGTCRYNIRTSPLSSNEMFGAAGSVPATPSPPCAGKPRSWASARPRWPLPTGCFASEASWSATGGAELGCPPRGPSPTGRRSPFPAGSATWRRATLIRPSYRLSCSLPSSRASTASPLTSPG